MPGHDTSFNTANVSPPRPLRPRRPSGAPRRGSHRAATAASGGRRRGTLIALASVAAVLALVYAGGAVIFSQVFYPNTSIAGADVSLLPMDAAVARIDAATSRYRLTVEGAGFSWVYTPPSAAPIVDGGAAARRVRDGNEPLAWPLRLARALTSTGDDASARAPIDLSAPVDSSLISPSFDEAAFDQEVATAVDAFNQHRSGSFDAPSSYDAATGSFTVEKARSNEKLNQDHVAKLAKLALFQLRKTVSLDAIGTDAFDALSGGVNDSQLQQACDAANALIGTNVTFKLGGSDAGSLDGAVLAEWITLDDALKPSLDTTKIAAWAHQLADSLNTVGTERTYTRPDGKVITVSDGTYGWSVDEPALTRAVEDAVSAKRTGDIEVPTTSQGAAWTKRGAPDWGAYADVDLTEQRARYFDASGKLLWETGIVSGKPDGQNDTPTGIYRVNAKLRNITLVSSKTDPGTGKPEYESPVQYWIAFIQGSIGFHDASWQRAAVYSDPTAYRWAGSHGCINTPLDKVIELYDLIQVGDAVIVHD